MGTRAGVNIHSWAWAPSNPSYPPWLSGDVTITLSLSRFAPGHPNPQRGVNPSLPGPGLHPEPWARLEVVMKKGGVEITGWRWGQPKGDRDLFSKAHDNFEMKGEGP